MLLFEDAPGYAGYVVARVPGAEPAPGAFGGVRGALGPRIGILGGSVAAGDERRFGWMIAPAPASPLGFDLVAIAAKAGEAGVDPLVRGAVDVPAAGGALVARELLEPALPDEPLAALVELALRAAAAGRDVVCLPSFAWSVAAGDDDRGRAAALRALARAHPELHPVFRRPAGVRARFVDREVRLSGGRRVRVASRRPPATVLRTASAQALREAMRVRGDRYLLVATGGVPDDEVVDALVERIEDDANVALAAPDAAALGGRCVLLHLGRFPQHVEPRGATLADALASLVEAARALRRGLRVPGLPAPPPVPAAPPGALSAVFLAGSSPELTRTTLDALLAQLAPGERVRAAVASERETSRRLLGAYPQIDLVDDAVDPLLVAAANRALGEAETPLVALLADDVLLGRGALDALRAAFAAIPTLGAAFPLVGGSPGGETSHDDYPDLTAFDRLAERRVKERAREREPIDDAATPALVLRRDALRAVGGLDPALGPTRRGIAELVARLRAAGYAVVRCEDAVAHRFRPEQSGNVAAEVDRAGGAAVGDVASAIASGFDPRRAVPFAAPAPLPAAEAALVFALPVASASELERAADLAAAAARAFDAAAPLRVHVLLDGDVAVAPAAARIRAALLAAGKPLASSVVVRIERAADLAAWRAALPAGPRLAVAAELPRAAFAGVAAVPATRVARLLAEAPA